MRMWVLESGYGNIRTTVWDVGSKYRMEMGTTCRYGNVGTRVWKPGMRTWECGNKSMGTNILEWNHSIGVGITVWERGYWNMGMGMGGSQLSRGIWEPRYGNYGMESHKSSKTHLREKFAHVLLHGLGVFLLGQFETLQFHFQFRELLLISGLYVLAAHPSSLVGPLGGCRCEGVWGRGGEGERGRG